MANFPVEWLTLKIIEFCKHSVQCTSGIQTHFLKLERFEYNKAMSAAITVIMVEIFALKRLVLLHDELGFCYKGILMYNPFTNRQGLIHRDKYLFREVYI